MNKLIFIKVLFGGDGVFSTKWHNHHPIYKDAMKDFTNDSVKNLFFHFVLGEHNRTFLRNIGVPDNKIIFLDKKPSIAPEGAHALYNKTFLLQHAAHFFDNNDILCTDYDCNIIRELDMADIHNSLELKNEVIQFPVVYYKRGIFTSNGKRRQNYGPQTCLTYWKNPNIIDKWFDYQIKNPNMLGDEPPLLLALEEMYGPQSATSLDRFDTCIVRTNHRPTDCEGFYSPENYKNAYFFHN